MGRPNRSSTVSTAATIVMMMAGTASADNSSVATDTTADTADRMMKVSSESDAPVKSSMTVDSPVFLELLGDVERGLLLLFGAGRARANLLRQIRNVIERLGHVVAFRFSNDPRGAVQRIRAFGHICL